MKSYRSAVRSGFALLAVLAVARPAAAGKQVPFRGSFDATVERTQVDPATVFVEVEGVGRGAHLGRFSVSAPHEVDAATRTAAGTYTFTAANGDTLTADFTGRAAPTETPGVLLIVEIATITGGTGRFAGASGSFTVERLYDMVDGTTEASFEGTVSSPGAGPH
jgi:hypothetical protein